jgi:signal transduction histidine kinase
VAAFVIATLAVAQRGLIAHPTWQWVAIALVVVPFVVDVRWPVSGRPWVAVLALSTVVIGLRALMLVDPPGPNVALLLLIVLASRVGAGAPLPVSVPIGAAVVALLVARPGDTSPAMLIGVAFAWSAGAAMRLQGGLSRRLLDARAAAAAAEERQRVARDIHDVIAHTMSVTLLHLAGARLALAEGERDEAMDSLRQAEVSGRAAMADIRQSIGLLGDPLATAGAAPERDLTDLVASYVDAGLKVEYHVVGEPANMPAPVAGAVYRIARESLSNAARHATDGAARVSLSVTDRRVDLRVCNSFTVGPVGRGHGIPGMTQRARLAGGALTAAPDGERWLVEATFPGRLR